MMEIDVFDLQDNWYNGVNAHIAVANSYYFAMNMYLEDGKLRTGWGVEKIKDLSISGRFQGAFVYLFNKKKYLFIGAGGVLYSCEYPYIENKIEICKFNSRADKIYFCQVNEFLIVQDGVNKPIVLLGNTIVPDHNLPRGTIMEFIHSRLFIKTGKYEFQASDIYLPYDPYNFLKFTENQYLAGGGALGIPSYMGEITAMKAVPTIETGDGNGYLAVFTRKGICGFNVAASRLSWNTIDISKVLIQNISTRASDGVLPFNTDVVFLTDSGISSLGVANQLQSTLLTASDMTTDANSLFYGNTDWAIEYSSIAKTEDYIFATVLARKRDVKDLDGFMRSEIYFNGVVEANTHPDITSKSTIVPESLIKDFDITTGELRVTINKLLDGCYFVGRDEYDNLGLFKLEKTKTPLSALIELHDISLTKQSTSDYVDYINKRRLLSVQVDVGRVKRITEIACYYRPSNTIKWILMDKRKLINQTELFDNNQGSDFEDLKFSNSPNLPASKLYDLMLIIRGDARINRVAVNGKTIATENAPSTQLVKRGTVEKNNYAYT
jgi:hypothetical protein